MSVGNLALVYVYVCFDVCVLYRSLARSLATHTHTDTHTQTHTHTHTGAQGEGESGRGGEGHTHTHTHTQERRAFTDALSFSLSFSLSLFTINITKYRAEIANGHLVEDFIQHALDLSHAYIHIQTYRHTDIQTYSL